jgi:hypothetical protein
MRHILAVAVLGASLALGTSAALAGEFDYADRQPVQSPTAQMQPVDQPLQGTPDVTTAPTRFGPDLGGWNK